jgi:uncharacterized protein (TIGR00266 family)
MSNVQAVLRGRPAFTHIVARLPAGAQIVAESDAMARMSGNVAMTAEFNGGLVNAVLLRLFARESLFVNRFVVAGGEGELVLTQPTPGDIAEVQLNGQELYLTAGSFIACTAGISVGVGWAGIASFLAGEGLFRLRVGGTGTVWFGGYGSVNAVDVGQGLIVDSGHLVAYDPTVSLKTRLAAGLFSSFFSGEGLVLDVRGPGRVYLQSRSVDGLASWVNGHLFGRR